MCVGGGWEGGGEKKTSEEATRGGRKTSKSFPAFFFCELLAELFQGRASAAGEQPASVAGGEKAERW